MRKLYWLLSTASLIALALLNPRIALTQDDGRQRPTVIHIQAEGPLTPALVSYIERGVRTAEARDAAALLLQLDTPGGEIGLLQDVVRTLRASRVPVIVYVAPPGGAAWSAGTVIVLAGHAAAMAPNTGIGAASPVGMGTDLATTEERKAKEAMRSVVRDLAEWRGEKVVQWAEAAVEEAVAATATEAYEMGLVDTIATNPNELLTNVDGMQVQVRGEPQVLHTAAARLEALPMNFVERILHIIVNPAIVLTLLAIGVQALLIEISSPGGWVAGFIGVVSIGLGVYGLGVLPVNGLGLILIALAIGLFVMEAKAPTHGALAVGGIAALVAGALILFNTPNAPQYARISLPVVAAVALSLAGASLFIMTKALQAQHAPPRTGLEALVGAMAQVRTPLDPQGKVFILGEYWNAVADDGPIDAGVQVTVLSVDGFTLHVQRSQNSEETDGLDG